jgi:broad specificity phosphatase PhoE
MSPSAEQHYTLTLLRHGESTGNAGNFIQGQQDHPLTAAGVQQARALAERWQAQGVSFDHAIASPLSRARQTAEIVAAALDIPVSLDPLWVERGFGVAEGLDGEAIRRQYPQTDFYHPYQPVAPGGESTIDSYQRALSGLLDLLHRPPGRYLIVSHGAILNMAVLAIIGITPQGHYNSPRFRFGNTGYASWSYRPETRQWYLLSFVNPEDWSGPNGADRG